MSRRRPENYKEPMTREQFWKKWKPDCGYGIPELHRREFFDELNRVIRTDYVKVTANDTEKLLEHHKKYGKEDCNCCSKKFNDICDECNFCKCECCC